MRTVLDIVEEQSHEFLESWLWDCMNVTIKLTARRIKALGDLETAQEIWALAAVADDASAHSRIEVLRMIHTNLKGDHRGCPIGGCEEGDKHVLLSLIHKCIDHLKTAGFAMDYDLFEPSPVPFTDSPYNHKEEIAKLTTHEAAIVFSNWDMSTLKPLVQNDEDTHGQRMLALASYLGHGFDKEFGVEDQHKWSFSRYLKDVLGAEK